MWDIWAQMMPDQKWLVVCCLGGLIAVNFVWNVLRDGLSK
jgi:hypothetical protein